MRRAILFVLLVCSLSMRGSAQNEQDPKATALLQQMVTALGGDAWLNRKTVTIKGRGAGWDKYEPTYMVPFVRYVEIDAQGRTRERDVFTKKKDDIEVWNGDKGYELTFKGKTELPAERLEERARRESHSLDVLVRVWLKDPKTLVIYDGMSTVGRWQADKISIYNSQNDNATVELDLNSHLPMRVTFKWRNDQFKDFDEAQEEYSDYHAYQGVQTPVVTTQYKNGAIRSQRYMMEVKYGDPLPDWYFDPEQSYKRKK